MNEINLGIESYKILKGYVSVTCYDSLVKNFSLEFLEKNSTFQEFLKGLSGYKIQDIPYLYGLFKQSRIFPDLKYFTILEKDHINLFFINPQENLNYSESFFWEDFFDTIDFNIATVNNFKSQNSFLFFRTHIDNKYILNFLQENSSEENRIIVLKKIIKEYFERKVIDEDLKEAYFILCYALLLNELPPLENIHAPIVIHSLSSKKEFNFFKGNELFYENLILNILDKILKEEKFKLIGRDLINQFYYCRNFEDKRESFNEKNDNIFKFIKKEGLLQFKTLFEIIDIIEELNFYDKIKKDKLIKENYFEKFMNNNFKKGILYKSRKYNNLSEFFTPTLNNLEEIFII